MVSVGVTRTGSYLPDTVVSGEAFLKNKFYDKDGGDIKDKTGRKKTTSEIVDKLVEISGIEERRYALEGQVASDLAVEAIKSSGIDYRESPPELLIVAHNFGDTQVLGEPEINYLPNKATMAKARLEIEDPGVIAVDVLSDRVQWEYVLERLRETDLARNIFSGDVNALSDNPGADYLVHASRLRGKHASLADRVIDKLGAGDKGIVGMDILYGCPGSLEGVVMAFELIKAGHFRTVDIVATEVLSRKCDPHDYDSMLYSDGGGLLRLESIEEEGVGILGYAHRTDADKAHLLTVGGSNKPGVPGEFLKMLGNDVHKYALKGLPEIISESLENSGVSIGDIAKFVHHQANTKLNHSSAKKCGLSKEEVDERMPMIIDRMGNNSVAGALVLYDLLRRGKLNGHAIESGDCINFASVGGSMNLVSLNMIEM